MVLVWVVNLLLQKTVSETAMGKKIYAQSNYDSEYVRCVYKWVLHAIATIQMFLKIHGYKNKRVFFWNIMLALCWHLTHRDKCDGIFVHYLGLEVIFRSPKFTHKLDLMLCMTNIPANRQLLS